MILKLTKYTNTPGTFEAEWVNREVTPAVGTEGEEGYQPESTQDTTLRVTAYSGDQIDLFRADVAQYGGEIDEALLAEVQAEWVPPPPPPVVIPQQVSRAQGKAVLIQMGLWQQVLNFVAAIPDPTQRALAEVALHDTQNWQRNSPFLNTAAAALGITQEQMDNLFITASQVAL